MRQTVCVGILFLILDKPNTLLKSLQSSYRNCTITVSTNRNTDNKSCFGQPSSFIATLYQFKHGLAAISSFMLKKVPISLSGPVMNIKLAYEY